MCATVGRSAAQWHLHSRDQNISRARYGIFEARTCSQLVHVTCWWCTSSGRCAAFVSCRPREACCFWQCERPPLLEHAGACTPLQPQKSGTRCAARLRCARDSRLGAVAAPCAGTALGCALRGARRCCLAHDVAILDGAMTLEPPPDAPATTPAPAAAPPHMDALRTDAAPPVPTPPLGALAPRLEHLHGGAPQPAGAPARVALASVAVQAAAGAACTALPCVHSTPAAAALTEGCGAPGSGEDKAAPAVSAVHGREGAHTSAVCAAGLLAPGFDDDDAIVEEDAAQAPAVVARAHTAEVQSSLLLKAAAHAPSPTAPMPAAAVALPSTNIRHSIRCALPAIIAANCRRGALFFATKIVAFVMADASVAAAAAANNIKHTAVTEAVSACLNELCDAPDAAVQISCSGRGMYFYSAAAAAGGALGGSAGGGAAASPAVAAAASAGAAAAADKAVADAAAAAAAAEDSAPCHPVACAAAPAPPASALPPGVRMPAFAPLADAAAGASAADVAVMLAELQRCGWMQEERRGIERSAVANIVAVRPFAAAVEGLHVFVADAVAAPLKPQHWSSSVSWRCKRAAAAHARAARSAGGADGAGGAGVGGGGSAGAGSAGGRDDARRERSRERSRGRERERSRSRGRERSRASARRPSRSPQPAARLAPLPLPIGMRMPSFAAAPAEVRSADVAAMLAELDACGWMREDGQGVARSAAAVAARWVTTGDAAEGLRAFVREAACTGLPIRHWSGAVVNCCKRASARRKAAEAAAVPDLAAGAGRSRSRSRSVERSRERSRGHTHARSRSPRRPSPRQRRRSRSRSRSRSARVPLHSRRERSPAELRERKRPRSRSRSPARAAGRDAAPRADGHRSAPLPARAAPPQAPAAQPPAAPPPAAPAAPAAPPVVPPPQPPAPRFHYRSPADGTVVRAYPLSVFAGWIVSGALSAEQAAALRVWRKGAAEDTAVPLSGLLQEAAAAHAGAA